MIESVENKKVKEWSKLKEKKYRDKYNLFLVESEHLVKEAIKHGVVIELIVLDGYVFEANLKKYVVSKKVMKKITEQVTIPNICAVCKKIKTQEVKGNIIMLDDILDPGNLGTIIRSAVAFNIFNIILSKKSVDLYNAKVLRSCEGMIFQVNVIRTDLEEFIKKHTDYTYFATDVENGLSPKEALFNKDKCAIIIGNEGMGMSSKLKKLCSQNLYIPINKNCESLNAAVSASILMYELNNKINGKD